MRRRLAGTTEDHVARARAGFSAAMETARDAKSLATTGRCKSALVSLMAAQHNRSMAAAHMQFVPPREWHKSDVAGKRVFEAQEIFEARCIRLHLFK